MTRWPLLDPATPGAVDVEVEIGDDGSAALVVAGGPVLRVTGRQALELERKLRRARLARLTVHPAVELLLVRVLEMHVGTGARSTKPVALAVAVETLARIAGLPLRSVDRAIAALLEAGRITRRRCGGVSAARIVASPDERMRRLLATLRALKPSVTWRARALLVELALASGPRPMWEAGEAAKLRHTPTFSALTDLKRLGLVRHGGPRRDASGKTATAVWEVLLDGVWTRVGDPAGVVPSRVPSGIGDRRATGNTCGSATSAAAPLGRHGSPHKR